MYKYNEVKNREYITEDGLTTTMNESTEGETLEMKIERVVNNNEAIEDGAEPLYTLREDGVNPDTNVRTDRFEAAIEAMDKVTSSHKAKRQSAIDERNKKKEETSANSTTPATVTE